MPQQEHDSMVTTVKSLTIISQNLRNTSSKNNIMKEAQEIFYENNFQNKLDVNPMLLGCKNGIIDFDKCEFREGQPEDYLSKYNYSDRRWNTSLLFSGLCRSLWASLIVDPRKSFCYT